MLIQKDCIEGMKELDDNSVDLLLTDFPYGTLNKRNKWDTIIDYDLFWKEAYRICKINGIRNI